MIGLGDTRRLDDGVAALERIADTLPALVGELGRTTATLARLTEALADLDPGEVDRP